MCPPDIKIAGKNLSPCVFRQVFSQILRYLFDTENVKWSILFIRKKWIFFRKKFVYEASCLAKTFEKTQRNHVTSKSPATTPTLLCGIPCISDALPNDETSNSFCTKKCNWRPNNSNFFFFVQLLFFRSKRNSHLNLAPDKCNVL